MRGGRGKARRRDGWMEMDEGKRARRDRERRAHT